MQHAALAMVASALWATSAAAQPRLELQVGRSPHYVGVPVELQIRSTGFERNPQPTCNAPEPPIGELRLVGLVPNFSSSMQIINGRVTRSETVIFTCQYEYIATKPGTVRLGPFQMTQGNTQLSTQQYAVRVKTVPVDPRIRVRVVLPKGPVYVGQRLPVRVEWWLDEKLQNNIRGYTLRGEIFDRDDLFRFVGDTAAARGDQTLNIASRSGESILKAQVRKRKGDDRNYIVVAAERTMIPLHAGEWDLDPASINVMEVTGWNRDLFGGRRPAQTRQIFAQDSPLELVVRAPPLLGRPDSFAGAVGKGFSLEVSADRSVVQLGDPITLTLTVRGDGNLANVAPPRLDAAGGLAPEHFRLPDRDVSGEIRGDAKVFKLPVRVLDDAVREIPTLAYSWFDPDIGEYQTAESRPIALSVRPRR